MAKKLLIIICLMLFPTVAKAGWFSPKSPEIIFCETIDIKESSVNDLSINFKERSSYRLSLILDPKIDFQSSEAAKLNWNEKFSFKMEIKSNEKIFYTYSTEEKLQNTFGWDMGILKVPSDIPKGEYTLSVEFIQVGSEFIKIYKGGSLSITKLPYIRFLD